MAENQEDNNAVVPIEEENEIQRSIVVKRQEVPPVPAEYVKTDIVKLSVLENGVRTSKKMEVIEVVPVAGKWKYKLRRPGEIGTYRENGIELFQEGSLSFW